MIRYKLAGLLLLLGLVPRAAAGQVSLTADRIYLGATGCQLRTGSGAPTGGSPCDFYLDTSSGHSWINAGGTWINVSTLVAVARGGTGVSSLAANGVLFGNGTSPIGVTAAPPANSLLAGNAGPPSFSSSPTVQSLAALSSLSSPALIAPGDLTITPAGDLVLDPTGRDILPGGNYRVSLGSPFRQFLSMHVAELWAESLVAQDVMATIGGRILVGPTTTLVAPVPSVGGGSIAVKHNNLAAGDILLLQNAPDGIAETEFMQVTSGASGIPGNYTYNVSRNLDGSGANAWVEGDAVFNTGSAGKGFLDLYALSGVRTGYGPTIVGNVRTGPAFDAFAPRWAIGNLNGIGYGHSVDTYGAAFGDPSSTALYIDTLSGVVIRNGASVKMQIDPAGNAMFAGAITANSGTIAGFSIIGDFFRDSENTFGLSSASSGADDVRFWAGASYANRASAPLRLHESGAIHVGNGTFNGDGAGVTNINGGNLQTGSITADKIQAGAITADKIAAGAVTAEKIAAGSITATKIGSGSGTNVIRNSECRTSAQEWTIYNETPGTVLIGFNLAPAWALNGQPSVCWIYVPSASAGQQVGVIGAAAPVIGGKVYEGSAYLGNHSSTAARSFAMLVFDDGTTVLQYSAGTMCTGASTGGAALAGYCRSAVIAAAPPTATQVRLFLFQQYDTNFGASYYFFVRAMIAEGKPNQTELSEWTPAGLSEITGGIIRTDTILAEHIAAGAITASELAAGAVTAGSIAAGSITGDKIAARTIAAGNIAAGNITGTEIAAATITGGHITASTITGGNIAASTITGGNIVAGTITASQIAASTITGDKIAADSISANHIQAMQLSAISADLGTVTAGNIFGVLIDGATVRAGSGDEVILDNSGLTIASSGGSGPGTIKIGAARIFANSAAEISLDASTTFAVGNFRALGNISGTGTINIDGSLTAGGRINANAAASVSSYFELVGGINFYWSAPPYVNSAQVHWSSSCACVGTVSSSARFKENIRPWAPDNPLAILAVPLVRYDLKAQPAYKIPVQPNLIGMIAEDLFQIAPDAVLLDDQRRPSGIRSDAFDVYLLAALRAVHDRIPRLEAQIAELEARLSALEAARKTGR